jgi:hypothetical protein
VRVTPADSLSGCVDLAIAAATVATAIAVVTGTARTSPMADDSMRVTEALRAWVRDRAS